MDASEQFQADTERYAVQYALQSLMHEIIEHESALGMRLGEQVAWQAGASGDERCYPQGRALASLTLLEIAENMNAIANYLRDHLREHCCRS